MSDDTATSADTGDADTSNDSSSGSEQKQIVEYKIAAKSIWQVIFAVLLTLVGVIVLQRVRDLVAMLIISIFFALAIIPLVERIHLKRGWKRGAAVGVIYGVGALFVLVMVIFLIPLMVDVARLIGDNWSTWMNNINEWASDTFNVDIQSQIDEASGAGEEAAGGAADWAAEALGGFLGALSSGIGLIFSAMTIALFTFYFAADHQRILALFLSMFPEKQQQIIGWTLEQAVEQTGGYFYSRLILMLINGTGFFFTMVVVGLPVLVALPVAIFAGFVSEFIPAVGTYIGGAVPVLLALALQGLVQGLIVLAYVLIYQQVENYWLSPKLSAQSMTLNGGVAFGAALAGGAIAGPMGAFMALPIAAMITSFLSHYRTAHEVVYHSRWGSQDELDGQLEAAQAVIDNDNADDSGTAADTP
ncbi:MAG: AI-2E family transporter [Acidimicrobiia bacterium]